MDPSGPFGPTQGDGMFEPPTTPVYRYEWEITPEGEMRGLSASPDLADLHGYDLSELAEPGGWLKVIAPEDREDVLVVIESISRGRPWSGRFPLRSKSGERKVVEVYNDVERRADGSLLVHGIVRDVTEQDRLERELKDREARMRALMDTVPVVLWSTDRDLRFTWSSGSALNALGLDENDVVGMDFFEFFETDDPSFPAIAAERRALSGETVNYELEWRGRTYHCSVEPFLDHRGEVTQTIGVAIDLTGGEDLGEEAREVGRDVARHSLAAALGRSVSHAPHVIDLDDICIDLRSQTVTKGNREIELTRTEFKLFVKLASNPGHPIAREELLGTVWGYGFESGSSPLWMTIRRLREKIEDDPHRPKWIETVRGVGYRLTPN